MIHTVRHDVVSAATQKRACGTREGYYPAVGSLKVLPCIAHNKLTSAYMCVAHTPNSPLRGLFFFISTYSMLVDEYAG